MTEWWMTNMTDPNYVIGLACVALGAMVLGRVWCEVVYD